MNPLFTVCDALQQGVPGVVPVAPGNAGGDHKQTDVHVGADLQAHDGAVVEEVGRGVHLRREGA